MLIQGSGFFFLPYTCFSILNHSILKQRKIFGINKNTRHMFYFIKLKGALTPVFQATVTVYVKKRRTTKIHIPKFYLKNSDRKQQGQGCSPLLRAQRYRWSAKGQAWRPAFIFLTRSTTTTWFMKCQWGLERSPCEGTEYASEIIKISAFETWKGSEQQLRKSIRVFYLQWHRCLSQ